MGVSAVVNLNTWELMVLVGLDIGIFEKTFFWGEKFKAWNSKVSHGGEVDGFRFDVPFQLV